MFNYILDKEDEFEVEKIVNFKDGKYLMKWVGYLVSENI